MSEVVYVVEEPYDYGSTWIVGVYRSVEGAQAAHPGTDKYPEAKWKTEDGGGFYQTHTAVMITPYEIREGLVHEKEDAQ